MQTLGVDALAAAANRQNHQLPNTHRQLRTGEVRSMFTRWDRQGQKRDLTTTLVWDKTTPLAFRQ